MDTGDKVLALVAAKLACCFSIGLAASGLLGGVGVWFMDDGLSYVALAFVIGIVATVLRPSPRRTGHVSARPAPGGEEERSGYLSPRS